VELPLVCHSAKVGDNPLAAPALGLLRLVKAQDEVNHLTLVHPANLVDLHKAAELGFAIAGNRRHDNGFICRCACAGAQQWQGQGKHHRRSVVH